MPLFPNAPSTCHYLLYPISYSLARYLEEVMVPDCNNCIRVVLEGGVVEARGLYAAGHSAGEDADRRVVGGACLSDAEVT